MTPKKDSEQMSYHVNFRKAKTPFRAVDFGCPKRMTDRKFLNRVTLWPIHNAKTPLKTRQRTATTVPRSGLGRTQLRRTMPMDGEVSRPRPKWYEVPQQRTLSQCCLGPSWFFTSTKSSPTIWLKRNERGTAEGCLAFGLASALHSSHRKLCRTHCHTLFLALPNLSSLANSIFEGWPQFEWASLRSDIAYKAPRI